MNPVSLTIWILGILSFIAGLASIISWIVIRYRYRRIKPTFYSPKVGIIVPCKGKDRRLRGNIKAICNQNYENYKIVFVVDSKKDPAYKVIAETIRDHRHAKVVTSKPIESSSGKIAALLAGIKTIGNVDIYVFADSDIRPHKNWVRYLISPLKDEAIGATTSYRWYFPHNLWTLVLSSWNACTAATLFLGKYNFIWGGSTAIRRKLFEKMDIEERWKNSLSDDLTLTAALKEKGYSIRFVPQAIVECFEEKNLYELIKWGTRQNVWTKWYYPQLWRKSVTGAVIFKTLNIIGFILIMTGNTIQGLLLFS
ncbi:MAG TPA: glycosyltransferase family 2 protein, partial [Thermoplasmatales archaeon]|nr:glycosyltransferase family 2 protein [Thermoplasmatales archaeon]